MTFSEKLCSLRKKQGWSQEQLAERLEVTRQSVSKWESGAAMPELSKLVALSDLFDVSLDYLVREHESMPGGTGDTARLEREIRSLRCQIDPTIYSFTSRTRVFGIPLVSVRFSRDRGPTRSSTAMGIIAIGNFAVGVISLGLISAGIFSIGMISLGLLLALGGVSIGALAVGGVAVGIVALGVTAVGVQLAIGVSATAKVAVGTAAKGNNTLLLNNTSRKEIEGFLTLYTADLWKPLRAVILWAVRWIAR